MNAPVATQTANLADPTRSLAFALLDAVLDKHRSLEDALDRLPPADMRNRAAAHRVAACVLRRAGTLDAVLEPHLAKAPPAPVRIVLFIGAAGLLFLGTPAHAAVGTAVDLARAEKLNPFAGMVNAVLRRVAEHGPDLLAQLDSPRLDTPAWLWSTWGDAARGIALAHQNEAPLDLTMRLGAAAPEGGIVLPTGSLRFPPGTRVADLPGFEAGDFWVQDAAAALPAVLLAAQPSENVADLCAAPGGKTAQLAATGARVTAVERDSSRMVRLRDNLDRLKMEVDLVHADALTWAGGTTAAGQFDAVLLDAPCTATGTIRRHPDVPYTKKPRDIQTLASTQATLRAAAAKLLKPGGRLIYAVCSLQPEEGPAHAPPPGLQSDPFSEAELALLPEARTVDGNLRTHPGLWPDIGGMDGFYAARYKRPLS